MSKFLNTATWIILLLLHPLKIQAQHSTKKSNYITTDDHIKLYAEKAGHGPVCIFIHGGPGAWSESFKELGGNNLERQLTMVYYDQRGSGRSNDTPNGNYSLNRMLKDIDVIREHLGGKKVYLLAHSFGGILAINYSYQYPEHVKGLILANSTLNLNYSLQQQTAYVNKLLKTNYAAANSDSIIPAFSKAKAALIKKKMEYKMLSDSKENVELLNEIDRENPSDFSFAQEALRISDYQKDYTVLTSKISIPVLVITGKKDHAIGIDHYSAFKFPSIKIAKINGGHLLYYEKNKTFIHEIFSFINEKEK